MELSQQSRPPANIEINKNIEVYCRLNFHAPVTGR